MTVFKPEGQRIDTLENRTALESVFTLQEAWTAGRLLEGRAILCDTQHNLIVDLGCARGYIPRLEGAMGIADGSTRDIAMIARVGKPVSFYITGFDTWPDGSSKPLLSRRAAQQACTDQYLSQLNPGDIIDARITHMMPFGAFIDVGCGISSLIPIDAISVSRISHPSDRFYLGQDIKAAVRYFDQQDRLVLTHRELLGSWMENIALFSPGETVAGIVRSVEDYGVFVELSPNLAGLAERKEGVRPRQQASVYIKSIHPEKMKVKLTIVDAFDAPITPQPPRYFLTEGHMDRWLYSPDSCQRVIETVFDGIMPDK